MILVSPGGTRRRPHRTHTSTWSRRRFLAVMSIALGTGVPAARADEELKPSGTLTIDQMQLAFIGSGNLGGGTLSYNGIDYPFTVGGLGIGGFGVSKITATGEVFNLTEPRFFPGAYVQFRYGAVVGDLSTGSLWLKNSYGVVLKLDAKRQGVALSLGGDAVYINFH
jgi:hypothetical protein